MTFEKGMDWRLYFTACDALRLIMNTETTCKDDINLFHDVDYSFPLPVASSSFCSGQVGVLRLVSFQLSLMSVHNHSPAIHQGSQPNLNKHRLLNKVLQLPPPLTADIMYLQGANSVDIDRGRR